MPWLVTVERWNSRWAVQIDNDMHGAQRHRELITFDVGDRNWRAALMHALPMLLERTGSPDWRLKSIKA